MEKLRQKFHRSGVVQSAFDEREPDEQESILADDTDAFRQSSETNESEIDITLRLKLSESSNNIQDEEFTPSLEPVLCSSSEEVVFSCDGDEPKGQTVFEIISTETVKDGHASYVVYRILLTRSSVVDKTPCVIEKRYSEFERLHSDLKKAFPNLMEDIAFPKKRLLGNFTPKTIAKRSRAFEQYLCHLFSIDEIRFSEVFLNFFYLINLKTAYQLMLESNYFRAIGLFQDVLPVQEKIVGHLTTDVGETLCALVLCCQVTDSDDISLKYGLEALKCYQLDENNKYYLPLLQTCIHLCWKLGKDKQNLEKMLSKQKRESKELPSLLSVIHSSII